LKVSLSSLKVAKFQDSTLHNFGSALDVKPSEFETLKPENFLCRDLSNSLRSSSLPSASRRRRTSPFFAMEIPFGMNAGKWSAQ
jgi:hypothetical protein